MKTTILAVGLVAISSLAAQARCPTLNGYLAFKKCYLEADGLTDRNQLELRYERMLAEDLANLRTRQGALHSRSLKDGRTTHLPNQPYLNPHNRTLPGHRTIEAEISQRQRQQQQNSLNLGRARNSLSVERGRIRSQDLLYGQSK